MSGTPHWLLSVGRHPGHVGGCLDHRIPGTRSLAFDLQTESMPPVCGNRVDISWSVNDIELSLSGLLAGEPPVWPAPRSDLAPPSKNCRMLRALCRFGCAWWRILACRHRSNRAKSLGGSAPVAMGLIVPSRRANRLADVAACVRASCRAFVPSAPPPFCHSCVPAAF